MRVTNTMMTNSFLRDIRGNLTTLSKLNSQLSSGKQFNRASESPIKAARSIQLRADINANEQYNANIKDTINYLDTTDTALDQVNNVFQRIRELMVSSGNASYGSDEKNAIRDEINEKISEVAQILNTSFDGKYVFGGTKSSSKPLKVMEDPATGSNVIHLNGKNGETLNLNSQDYSIQNQIGMIGANLSVEISKGVTVDYNVSAMDVLMYKDESGKDVNVMNLFKDISSNLVSDDPIKQQMVVEENLAAMDTVITNLSTTRSKVGALQNRMDSALEQNQAENINMTEILSGNEDIDFAEKTMEVAMAQTIYMAALQTSAKVIQPTLMDYLR